LTRFIFSGRRRDDAPWIVLVEGLPAEEHRHRLAAEIARARLVVTRYLKSSVAATASGAGVNPDTPPKDAPQGSLADPTTTPTPFVAPGAVAGTEDQLTYEGRT
jgi:hypothetical protein